MSRATKASGRTRTRIAVVAAAAMITGFFPLSNAHGVDPGKNGAVVFVYNELSGRGGLATESADGRSVKHIVKDAQAQAPAWSANGRLIAYASKASIRIVKADGTFVRALAAHGNSPTWSRDGSQIAFTIANSIYKQSTKGGPITRLTTSPKGCKDQKPRWSPIAPSVVFFRFCTTSPHRLVYTVSTSSKALHLVTADGLFDPHDRIENPDFMPGGKRIALTANCSAPGDCIDNTNRIVTVNLNGGDRISITHEPTCDPESGCYPYESLKASPDGHDYLYDTTSNGAAYCWASLHHGMGYTGDFGDDAYSPDWQPLH